MKKQNFNDIKNPMHSLLWNRLYSNAYCQIKAMIWEKIWAQMRSDINNVVRFQLWEKTRNQITHRILDSIKK